MTRRPLMYLAISLFVTVGVVSVARAQSNSTGNAPAPTAQTSATNSSAQPAGKKVWTNDDVTDLRGESVISTVGSTSNSKTGNKPSPAARNNNAKSYQTQIARLEAQIPPLDSQIAELQAAIEGKPTGDGKSSQRPRGVKTDDWSVEMQQLQAKRDNIQAQISSLRDDARHHGFAPNTLP